MILPLRLADERRRPRLSKKRTVLRVLSVLLALAAIASGLLAFLVNRAYIAAFAFTLILWLIVYMMSTGARTRQTPERPSDTETERAKRDEDD
jgi:multisubunit Na+/H+ antiporter MnhG subunit